MRVQFTMANLLKTLDPNLQGIISSITSDAFLDVITVHWDEQVKQSVEPLLCKRKSRKFCPCSPYHL